MRRFINVLLLIFVVFSLPLNIDAQESKNGYRLPPRGTIRVLVVFAEIVGSCCQGTPSNNWPTGSAAPPNADKYLDYVVNTIPTTKLTKYYKDISLGEYNVIGDYYNGTVQVPCSTFVQYYDHCSDPYNTGYDFYYADQTAIAQLNNEWQPVGGNFLTAHGLNLNSFDDYQTGPTTNDGAVKLSGNPDGVIDVTVVLWRNHPRYGCSGGLGVANYMGGIPLKNKTVNLFGAWEFCPDNYNDPNNPDKYDVFFTQEYFHGLFGSNNFHTGGGADLGTFMFDATASWSTTAQGSSSSNIVCGWDRKFMNWKGTRQFPISALNQSNQEVVSDITVASSPNTSYYVLRDFITVGDAIRIKLPHFNWQTDGDKKNQYLWLENHQMVNVFDRNFGKLPVSNCSQWAPGLYAYIQAGKDIISGSTVYGGGSYASPNQLNDWLFPLPADGRWDFFYSFTDKNTDNSNCAWGHKSLPYSTYYPDGSRKPNPFTGYTDGYGAIDSDNNGTIYQVSSEDYYQKGTHKWLGVPTVGTIPTATLPSWGDQYDAFTQLNQKITLATNPSTAPVYTHLDGSTQPLGSYENRSIHLNNLSVRIVSTNYYNVASGPKSFLIEVKWDEKAIENDVRWCGNIVLQNDPLDPQARTMQIDIKPNKIITVDRGLSPTTLIEKTPGLRDFTDPSYLHLLNGTTTILESGSKINVINGSIFHVQAGATLIIGPNASVNIDATSFICIEDGANVVFQDANTSRIVINGKSYFGDYDIVNTRFLNQPNNYYALNSITASGTTTGVNMPIVGSVLLQARNSITLLPNVTIAATATKTFEAKIFDPYNCSNVNNYNLRTSSNNNANDIVESSDIMIDGIGATILNKNVVSQIDESLKINNTIYIYPNPNSGEFTINTNYIDGVIEIFDVLGNKIKQLNVSNSQYSQLIDMSEYGKGIYVINVLSQGSKTTKRIIIQ